MLLAVLTPAPSPLAGIITNKMRIPAAGILLHTGSTTGCRDDSHDVNKKPPFLAV